MRLQMCCWGLLVSELRMRLRKSHLFWLLPGSVCCVPRIKRLSTLFLMGSESNALFLMMPHQHFKPNSSCSCSYTHALLIVLCWLWWFGGLSMSVMWKIGNFKATLVKFGNYSDCFTHISRSFDIFVGFWWRLCGFFNMTANSCAWLYMCMAVHVQGSQGHLFLWR